MSFCVYKHTSPTGKIYIGITSIDPKKRWNGGYGYRDNPHFFAAIKKHGWANFEHEIIHSNLTRAEAENVERELISINRSNVFAYGYNRDAGGSGSHRASLSTRLLQSERAQRRTGAKNSFYGHKHRPESIAMVSAKNSGKRPTDEQKHRQVKARFIRVFQKDLAGNVLAEYESIKAAASAVNACPENIQRACKKGRPTARGYIWDYVDGCRNDRRRKPFINNPTNPDGL